MPRLLFKDEVYSIVGAAMEVHNILGCGFLEAVYQEALEIDMTERNIPFEAQHDIPVVFKERTLKKHYVADLLAYDAIVVELKAADRLTGTEEAQLLNYLKATKMGCGLLLNFGGKKLEWKRMVL